MQHILKKQERSRSNASNILRYNIIVQYRVVQFTLLVGEISTRPAARVFEILMMSLTRCPPVRSSLEGLGVTPLKCRVTVMRGDSRVDQTLNKRTGVAAVGVMILKYRVTFFTPY